MSTGLEYPVTDIIEPDHARQLLKYCAVLVIEDLPVGSGFGIDLSEFCTGNKFRGAKLIPPGLHFVFASAISKDGRGSVGPRTGFYHEFKSQEFVVKRWSPKDEEFDNSFVASEEQIDRYRSNLFDLDRYLGPYKYSTYKLYTSITSRISLDVARQISRDNESCNKFAFTSIDKKHDEALIESGEVTLVTQYYLDTTTKLDTAFQEKEGRIRLLGEFEFAFITLIVLHIYECFEHWLNMVCLICCADRALCNYPEFFIEFIDILGNQLQQVPSDLFEDVPDSTNRIRRYLDIFFQNINANQETDSDLKRKASELKASLELKFLWGFELEPDDELPVVVDQS